MKKKLLFVVLCAAWAGPASAESLSAIYGLALQNDYKLMAAQSAFAAGQESKAIARSALLPKVSAEAALNKSQSTTQLDSSNPFATDVKNVAETSGPGYIVSLTQPLVDFSALHDYKRGVLSAQSAGLELESARLALMIRTADAYLQALTAGSKLAAAQSAEEAFGIRLKAAKLKYDVGMARVSDLLDAQSALDSAAADSVVAKNNLNVLFDFLKVITGQDHTELNALPDNFIANPPAPADFQQWADAAIKNNPDIQIAKNRLESAYENSRARASDHLPKLAGRVDYSDGNDKRTYSSTIPDRLYQRGWTAKVVLSVPLFSGGGTSAIAREARYRYDEQRANSGGVERETMQATHSIYLSVTSGVAAVNARKAAIESSQSALEYAKKGYEEGVVSMINVLDAQRLAYQANRDYADALYNYLISGLRLKEIAGVLNAGDIDALSRQLDGNKKIYRPSAN